MEYAAQKHNKNKKSLMGEKKPQGGGELRDGYYFLWN